MLCRLPLLSGAANHLEIVPACLQYYEFWTRALEPGRHYVALKSDEKEAMCLDVAEKVGAGIDNKNMCNDAAGTVGIAMDEKCT